MITIPVNNRGRTVIGRLGENEHRCIAFRESAAVLEMYPSAVVAVLHQRPGDPEAYPVSGQYVAIEDGVVKWTIQSGDLNATGCGQCELVFSQGGIVAKTMIYQTEILPALDGAGTPPEPWESWVQEVNETADDACAWATGRYRNGEPVPEEAPQHENSAGYWAEQAMEAADSIIPATVAQTKAYLGIT